MVAKRFDEGIDEGIKVLNAGTGEEVESEDLVAEGGVNIKVEGNLSVGAFRFFEDRLYGPRAQGEVCPGSRAASAEKLFLADSKTGPRTVGFAT